MKNLARLFAVALASLTGTALAQSTDWPNKPVRMLVPYIAGASFDINARLFAAWAEKTWKQPFIVENRTGAAGNIAADAVVKAAPDGYLLLVHSHAMSYQHHMIKSTPFNANRDLAPIAIFGTSGSMVTVATSVPATTLAEFVAYVKANPGKVNYGGASIMPELEDLYSRLGLQMTPILYQGLAPQLVAIANGELQMILTIPLQAIPLVKEGRARAIVYTGPQRHPAMPEVPTVRETGLADWSWEFWPALFGPAALPAPIIAKLNAGMIEFGKTPEAVERFRTLGQIPNTSSPEAIRRQMVETEKSVAAVLKRLNYQPQ